MKGTKVKLNAPDPIERRIQAAIRPPMAAPPSMGAGKDVAKGVVGPRASILYSSQLSNNALPIP